MGLFNYVEKMGGVFVAKTYSAAWSIRLDPKDPLEAIAIKSLMSYPSSPVPQPGRERKWS